MPRGRICLFGTALRFQLLPEQGTQGADALNQREGAPGSTGPPVVEKRCPQRGHMDLRSDQLEFFVAEEAPGQFSWGLRDAEGKVVAKSATNFPDREAATAAMVSVADSLPGAAVEEE